MRKSRRKYFKNSVLSGIFAALMSALFLCSMSLTVCADADENTNQAGESLVKINVYYTDKNGSTDLLKSGTGFFIDNGTVLTARSVVSVTKNEAEGLEEGHPGILENYSSQAKFSYKIFIKDREYTATIPYDSDTKNFSVLTYDYSTVNNQPIVPVGDSSGLTSTAEEKRVLAIGFTNRDFNSYKVMNGIIKEINSYSFSGNTGVDCLYHDGKFTDKNSAFYVGGPLLDSNGVVIGLNTGFITKDENKYTVAIAINEIKEDLDKFVDLNYTNYGGAISSGESSKTENSESESSIADESSEAETVLEPETEAVAGFDEEDIENSGDEEKGFNGKLIIIIIGAAVIVILIIVIIVVAIGGKGKNASPVPVSNGGFIPPKDVAPGQGGQPFNTPMPPNDVTMPADPGATTVLGSDAGATTVLGQQSANAELIRKSTGESKPIVGTQFVIGKDGRQSNYVISNNSSISRSHCKITCINGTYSISDLNSTNGTFLNDIKIAARQEMPLNNGDRIKISDEEFTFVIK